MAPPLEVIKAYTRVIRADTRPNLELKLKIGEIGIVLGGSEIVYNDNGFFRTFALKTTDVDFSSLMVSGDTTLEGEVRALVSLDIGNSIPIEGFLDEEDMVSNSPVKGVTQQSLKAYVDSRSESGSFTGTFTGFTTNPTMTVNFVREGNIVILHFTAALSATSNSTSFGMTGLPASLTPASVSPKHFMLAHHTTDNNIKQQTTGCGINSGATIAFQKWDGTAYGDNLWTASGVKGFGGGMMLTYSLD